MNVQAGDLAVIVQSYCEENIGAFVDVVEYLGVGNVEFGGWVWTGGGPVWLVKAKGRPLKGGGGDGWEARPYSDACLRPIRPQADPKSTETTRELEHS